MYVLNFSVCNDDPSLQKDQKIKEQEILIEKLQATKSAVQRVFNEDQIKKLEKPNVRYHYLEKTIQDCIQVYIACGASGYNFLRDEMHYPYPHLSTLRNHLRGVECNPGIVTDFFKLMKQKVDKMTDPKEKLCCLLLDEMAIAPKKEYDTTTQSVIGYPTIPRSKKSQRKNQHMIEHDYAKGVLQREPLASHAFAFMICNIWGPRWKQLVAFEFTASSFDADVVTNMIYDIINKSKEIGLVVRALTMDMGSGNIAI